MIALLCLSLMGQSPEPQVKVDKSIPGASIFVWYPGDATDLLIGPRNWYVGDDYLYIAVSSAEFKALKRGDVFYPEGKGWAWLDVFRDGYVRNIWYAREDEPTNMLRADLFLKFKDQIAAVHKGDLPESILRSKKKK